MNDVRLLGPHVLEAKGTDVELWRLSEYFRIRGVVPAVNLVPADLDAVYVFYLNTVLLFELVFLALEP